MFHKRMILVNAKVKELNRTDRKMVLKGIEIGNSKVWITVH